LIKFFNIFLVFLPTNASQNHFHFEGPRLS